MTPQTLKAISLHHELETLFDAARDGRRIGLNALPEERVADFLAEELAPVLVRLDALIEGLTLPLRLAQEKVA